MIISTGWRQAYTELTAFITGHSEIQIGASVISIPQSIRSEFYRLFDAVRAAFLKERLPLLIDEAETLSRRYAEVREKVSRLLELDEVSVSSTLQQFLDKPTTVCNRVLLGSLFDLLRGNTDFETFEQTASNNIVNLFQELYHIGYQKWVALSLITLLAPDKAFRVPIDYLDERVEGSEMNEGGSYEEQVPDPEQMKRLSLKYDMLSTFIVPDIIAYLAKINQYISIRTETREAIWISKSPVSKQREWLYLKLLREKYGEVIIWPDIVIYASDKLDELVLIADFIRFCRPDLVIQCIKQKDWYEKRGLDEIKLHHNAFKPRRGTYVVSREPVPEQAYKELVSERGPEKQEPGIHILTVGLDQSKLEPIISIFKNRGTIEVLSS